MEMAKASSEIAASPASLSMLPSALMQEIDQSVTQLIRNVKAAKGEQLGAHSYSYTITGSSKSRKGRRYESLPFLSCCGEVESTTDRMCSINTSIVCHPGELEGANFGRKGHYGGFIAPPRGGFAYWSCCQHISGYHSLLTGPLETTLRLDTENREWYSNQPPLQGCYVKFLFLNDYNLSILIYSFLGISLDKTSTDGKIEYDTIHPFFGIRSVHP
jgi:hypothetical protein